MPLKDKATCQSLMTLKEILNEIPTASPGRLSELNVSLATYYERLSEQLADILVFKTDYWLELRKQEDVKSDKMADRLWDATDKGKDEIKIRYTTKGIEKVMSTIKTMLRTKENESRNQY